MAGLRARRPTERPAQPGKPALLGRREIAQAGRHKPKRPGATHPHQPVPGRAREEGNGPVLGPPALVDRVLRPSDAGRLPAERGPRQTPHRSPDTARRPWLHRPRLPLELRWPDARPQLPAIPPRLGREATDPLAAFEARR